MEKFYNDVLPLIDSAVERIESKRRSDTLVFPLFTDLHTMDAEHEYSKKLIFVLEKLCSKTSVEGVVNLGDTFNMLGRMIQIPNGELEIRFNELFSKIHAATGVPLINVNGKEATYPGLITVYNINGQVLATGKGSIGLHQFERGIYILQGRCDGHVNTIKVAIGS